MGRKNHQPHNNHVRKKEAQTTLFDRFDSRGEIRPVKYIPKVERIKPSRRKRKSNH